MVNVNSDRDKIIPKSYQLKPHFTSNSSVAQAQQKA